MGDDFCESYVIHILFHTLSNQIGVTIDPTNHSHSLFRLTKQPKNTVHQQINQFISLHKLNLYKLRLLSYRNVPGAKGTEIHCVVYMKMEGEVPGIVLQSVNGIKDQEILRYWEQVVQERTYPIELVLTRESTKV